jgi:hypothetical protein
MVDRLYFDSRVYINAVAAKHAMSESSHKTDRQHSLRTLVVTLLVAYRTQTLYPVPTCEPSQVLLLQEHSWSSVLALHSDKAWRQEVGKLQVHRMLKLQLRSLQNPSGNPLSIVPLPPNEQYVLETDCEL